MPVDSINYGREIKNLRAEIAELRTEVAFMYSAFQDIQEQFGLALAEIANLIRTSDGNRKNDFEKIQTDFQEKFDDVKVQSKKIFDRQNEQSDFITDLMNENFHSVQDKFAQLEKISDTQQINFGNHFDAIENSVAAQQKMFEEIFSRQNSEVIEKISKVGVSVEENQKTLLKKIDSANDKPKDFYKTLNAIEELLRLIAANQMLDEVENNLPTKNNSSQKISSSGKKKIYIYGRSRVGKTTLAEILKLRIDNIEIIENVAINSYDVPTNSNTDKIIYIIDESEPNSTERYNFYGISKLNKKILLVVNVTSKFPSYSDEQIFYRFKNKVDYTYSPSIDWSKVSAVNVYLQGAREAWAKGDYGKFHRSNFDAIEKFINEN